MVNQRATCDRPIGKQGNPFAAELPVGLEAAKHGDARRCWPGNSLANIASLSATYGRESDRSAIVFPGCWLANRTRVVLPPSPTSALGCSDHECVVGRVHGHVRLDLVDHRQRLVADDSRQQHRVQAAFELPSDEAMPEQVWIDAMPLAG
jgi:hypothetical protein